MSSRSETKINSELFMSDPVPIRSHISKSLSNNKEQGFFVKGDEGKEMGYEHIGGDEDIFIIKGQGDSFQLHRKVLKDTLVSLKSQAHVSIRQLNPQNTEYFKSVVEALRLLYGSPALYDLVLLDIRSVFGDIQNVKPGELGAFFIGCFSESNFNGPQGCNPTCVSSIVPTDGTPGYSVCEDLVLIYSDGSFSSLNERQSKHAYVYISEDNFQGFSNANIEQLKEAGLVSISLIFGNPDGSYKEMGSPLTLNQLPKSNGSVGPMQVSQQTTTDTTDTSDSGAGIVIAVIIIIMIILLLIFLYRGYKPWN